VIAFVSLYSVFLLLLVASYTDVTKLRIPNTVVIAIAGMFLPFALASGMSLPVFGMHLAAGAAVLVVVFVLFTIGLKFGGGDAKLFAALALWCGFTNLGPFVLAMCFVGGGVAVIVYMLRQFGIPIWLIAHGVSIPALELEKSKPYVPYALAMAGAFILVFSPFTTTLHLI
jgi:prepilin peptidase CpaA